MTSHGGTLSSWICVVAVGQSPSLCSQSVHRYVCVCVCVCVCGVDLCEGVCVCVCVFLEGRYTKVWPVCVDCVLF